MNIVCKLSIVLLLAGCGDHVSVDDLPELPVVETSTFLPGVAQQLSTLREQVAKKPLSAQAAGELGMVYLVYKHDDAAEAAMHRARLLAPDHFEWKYYHAEALKRLGKLVEAAQTLEEARLGKPDYVHTRIRLGELYLQLGEPEKARAYLAPVVADNPDIIEAHLALARVLLRANEPDAALIHLNRVAARSSAGVVFFALADAWRQKGYQKKAAAYHALFERYRQSGIGTTDELLIDLRRLDMSDRPLMRQADRLRKAGKNDEAIQMLHRALERNPQGQNIHTTLVGAYGALKQFDKADAHYQHALKIGPPTVSLLRNLGRVRIQEGRLPAARQVLRQALEINPNDARSYAYLGVIELKEKNLKECVSLLQRALELDPNEAVAHFNLAEIFFDTKHYAGALVHLHAMAASGGSKTTPRVWRQIGESYSALGDVERARQAFKASIESAARTNNIADRNRAESLLELLPR